MAVDPLSFRRALSRFATGVSVLATRHADGAWCGLTVNALTSVSLSPPQILACVDRRSSSYPCLVATRKFVVSFLSASQHAVSARFAERRRDKFDGVAFRLGVTGLPILEGSIGHVECEVEAEFEGGDHAIFLARVVAAEAGGGEPLVFFSGGYTTIGPVVSPAPGESLPDEPEVSPAPGEPLADEREA
jgi:flavin reductase (DIM6/NTAB) family NADH-FMN oxidoreductase RutF